MTSRIAAALLLIARVAAADAPDAERLYNEGQTAYDDERYDDAITAWQKSYALSHLPALVFNLAQAHRLAGHCAKAVESYQMFIKLDPTSPQRADADSRLKEIQPCPPTVVAPPPKVVPPPPPPPPHVDASNPGHGKRIAGILLAGAGVALAGGGAYFGDQASSAASDVKAACATHCEWTSALAGKDADGRRDVTLQYAAYGAGAAALLAGILVYRSGAHARNEHAQVVIVPRADGAALTWTGSW